MSTSFLCRWHRDHADEPVALYEELGDGRMETRKVHEYRDGSLIRTDRVSDDDVSLGLEPVPPEVEIDDQREFEVLPLSRDEFDAAWARATDAWA